MGPQLDPIWNVSKGERARGIPMCLLVSVWESRGGHRTSHVLSFGIHRCASRRTYKGPIGSFFGTLRGTL